MPMWRSAWRASAAAVPTPPTPMRSVARQQESYDLSDLDWPRIDASGTPDETLARARAAIG